MCPVPTGHIQAPPVINRVVSFRKSVAVEKEFTGF